MATISHVCLAVLALACVSGYAQAQKLFWGQCPTITPVAYDAAQIEGVWYLQRRYKSMLESFSRCNQWTFTESATVAGSLSVDVEMRKFFNTKSMTIQLVQEADSTDAEFTLTISQLPGVSFGWPGTKAFSVIAVTADYMVAWSCYNSFTNLKNYQLLWVFTRDQTEADTITADAITAAAAAGVNTSFLKTVRQTSC